ncbi:MAG TPA: phosphatidylglycerophosphatase A [Sedimentisphaerales bacterium]|nr:phosphatidylglycerophosphatase A [Sedimentisphaerales bacterium]
MKRVLASCFGLGRLPIAPGTWGSLPVALAFGLMCHFGASKASAAIVMAALVVVGCVICITCGPAAIAATRKEDPGEVVADEFAGQALTFLVGGLGAAVCSWGGAAAGFILFRLFDIVKPWPICRFEKLPGAWGVLADDLMAGIYAGIGLLILARLWPGALSA